MKELEVLDNMILEKTILRNVQLNKLKKLALFWNRIIYISVLGKVNYHELREIDLPHIRLEDIKVGKYHFGYTRIINLIGNKKEESEDHIILMILPYKKIMDTIMYLLHIQ